MNIRQFIVAVAMVLVTAPTAMAMDEDASQTHVKRFGARGDGMNDDTGAFQQAINSVRAGGLVVLPEGNFRLSATVVITRPVTIVGAGFSTQIHMNGNRPLFRLENVNNAVIRDVYLGSNATQPGVSLIELVNSHHNRLDNITMLGGYYGLYLKGSLLNTFVDVRSGTNFGGFFAPTSVTNTWVMAEAYNNISANANTFLAPVLEGGVNGMIITDNNGQGSVQIVGGTMEGQTGTGLTLDRANMNSSITGVHFEANGLDVSINVGRNIRLSSIFSPGQINIVGDSRNISITDSLAQNISIDMGDGRYPLGTGAKRIVLDNITTCFANGPSVISPAPTTDPNYGMTNGPSSPIIPNPMTVGTYRRDIVYRNLGYFCGGG